MYPDYKGKALTSKTMSELPRSDGSAAYSILNFDVDESGYLTSKFSMMPLIPDEWNDAVPAPFDDVRGMAYAYFDGGVRPEILFFSADGVFRYAPWLRRSGSTTKKGLEEQVGYRYDNSTYSIKPVGRQRYPVQSAVMGDRIYFSFCDGGGLWVWDGIKVRSFGYSMIPGVPNAFGPVRFGNVDGSGSQPNGGGFTHQGRVGTIHGDINASDAAGADHGITVGGIRDGEWSYAVVYENEDGAYSPMSPLGGTCTIRMKAATDPSVDNATFPEQLRRQFWVYNIPTGPEGTVARIVLRTPDLLNVTTGLDHRARFLTRIPNNVATEFVDNIPDGELGSIWEDREATATGVYFIKSHAGSLFQLRTDGQPYRVWWSERTHFSGATPESVLRGHWIDMFPSTGAITGSASVHMITSAGATPMLMVFKEQATHYISGKYPDFASGTLHKSAGLAGPSLVQVDSSNSVVWYGNNTFWHLDTNKGKIIDVGVNIRESLGRVNQALANMGTSWVRPDTKELVFCLPSDDSTRPDLCFIWDHRFSGWRLRDNIIATSALTIPKMGITLLSGSVNVEKGYLDNIWVENRGYPNYSVVQPVALYKSGWTSMTSVDMDVTSDPLSVLTAQMRGADRVSSSVHAFSNVNDLVVVMKETSTGSATVSSYIDWDDDTYVEQSTLHLSHPEQQPSIPLYDSSPYDDSIYRNARVYTDRIALGISSASVFQVQLAVQSSVKLLTLDVYGPAVSLPGGRSPQ